MSDRFSDILPTVLQSSVVISTIAAGLLATPHCMGMCGPLAFAIGSTKRRIWLQQAGRGLGYAILGAIAGGLGPNWSNQGPARALSLAAMLLIAAVVLSTAWRLARGERIHGSRPEVSRFARARARAWQSVMRTTERAPNLGAFLAGLASFLLPCGQLYLFAAAALATGHAATGAGLMVLFWIGTLPSFVLGPTLIRRWIAPWAKRAPRAAAAALLIAGLSSLLMFARHLTQPHAGHSSPVGSAPAEADTQAHCH